MYNVILSILYSAYIILIYQVSPGPCHIPCLPVGVPLRKAFLSACFPGVSNTVDAPLAILREEPPHAELTDKGNLCFIGLGPQKDLLS